MNWKAFFRGVAEDQCFIIISGQLTLQSISRFSAKARRCEATDVSTSLRSARTGAESGHAWHRRYLRAPKKEVARLSSDFFSTLSKMPFSGEHPIYLHYLHCLGVVPRISQLGIEVFVPPEGTLRAH